MPARTKSNGTRNSSANLGFEPKLWLAADKFRNNMDAAECIKQSEHHYVPVILPPLPIQKATARFPAAWTEQIQRNEAQCRSLGSLRDTLLPKLLSGELATRALNGTI